MEVRSKPNSTGGAVKMGMTRGCSASSCSDLAVTFFAGQDLCLNHFVSRCYEDLDKLDTRGRRPGQSYSEAASTKSFIEECSRKALEVSLGCQHLDNLQRGRLLDILLWAGELAPLNASVSEQGL